jgi:hypothetical protein
MQTADSSKMLQVFANYKFQLEHTANTGQITDSSLSMPLK